MIFLDNQEKKIALLNSLNFLVICENFNYIFSDFKEFYKKLDFNEIFLEILEIFISKGKIKFMPNEVFNEVINYYSKKKKSKILTLLIINLNITKMNSGLIISHCAENDLFTALIYVCNRSNWDFLTPLIQMFGKYKEIIQSNDLSVNYFILQILEIFLFVKKNLKIFLFLIMKIILCIFCNF